MKKISILLLLGCLVANENALSEASKVKQEFVENHFESCFGKYVVTGIAVIAAAIGARALLQRKNPHEAVAAAAAPIIAGHLQQQQDPAIQPPKPHYAGNFAEPHDTPPGSAISMTPRTSQSTTPRSGQSTPRTLAGVRVLLVEDNAVAQAATRTRLQRAGSGSVTVAACANDAVQLAVDGEFDVVLMDNQMPLTPGRDQPLHENAGLEATAEIKRRLQEREAAQPPSGRRRSVPVIMHSSNPIPPLQLSRHSADGQIVKGQANTDEYIDVISEIVAKEEQKN